MVTQVVTSDECYLSWCYLNGDPMPKKVVPLTDSKIKNAKPKDKEYNLTDGDGLMLRIKPNGAKLWIFNFYRPYTNKRASMSFGQYPSLTLLEAREKRKEARALIANYIDPQERRDQLEHDKADAKLTTFEQVARQWLELKKTQVKPKTADKILQRLENHLLGELGKLPVSEIDRKRVRRLLQPIEAKGSHETVKRLCSIIKEVMRYAERAGWIERNDFETIAQLFQAPATTKHATIKPERLPELMQALASASIMRLTRCLVEWQLHTMVRPVEAVNARWEDIDLSVRTWTIPAEVMKMGREHTVPLTEQTLALLEILRPLSGHRKFVFPNHRDPKGHASSQSVNMALKRIGFKGELVSHGLRSLASTTLNEEGFNPDVIEACLAHQDKNQVRAAYNRAEYLEPRRKVMAWWSAHIEKAAEGNISLSGGARGLSFVKGNFLST